MTRTRSAGVCRGAAVFGSIHPAIGTLTFTPPVVYGHQGVGNTTQKQEEHASRLLVPLFTHPARFFLSFYLPAFDLVKRSLVGQGADPRNQLWTVQSTLEGTRRSHKQISFDKTEKNTQFLLQAYCRRC